MYRFKGRATGRDTTGYYYARWSDATSVSVLAETKAEAVTKALHMLGRHPRFGSHSNQGWAIIWDAIDEEAVTPDA